MSNFELFEQDMTKAGRKVEPYSGRWFYKGPAIMIDDPSDLQDVIRATKVRLQTDDMGLGLVVYPVHD